MMARRVNELNWINCKRGEGATAAAKRRAVSTCIKAGPQGPQFLHGDFVGCLAFLGVSVFMLVATIVILIEPFVIPEEESVWCSRSGEINELSYPNPDYDSNPCRKYRIPALLYLSRNECDKARRLLISSIFGGVIGYERKSADRPAGIRTMGLVSLGSCLFTISSQLAFRSSTMHWDAARVSAAIPSGVGFLGAALIWKGTHAKGTPHETHEVHGLTTAAALWLAAAVGVGTGGRLYVVSGWCVVLVIVVLRLGPRAFLVDDDYDWNEIETQNEALSAEDSSHGSSSAHHDIASKDEDEEVKTAIFSPMQGSLKNGAPHTGTEPLAIHPQLSQTEDEAMAKEESAIMSSPSILKGIHDDIIGADGKTYGSMVESTRSRASGQKSAEDFLLEETLYEYADDHGSNSHPRHVGFLNLSDVSRRSQGKNEHGRRRGHSPKKYQGHRSSMVPTFHS